MTGYQGKPNRVPFAQRYGPPLPPAMIEALAEEWYQANKEAIDENNAHVREHGPLLDNQRVW